MTIYEEQLETQNEIPLNQQKTSHKIHKTGQLRRAKMHVSCLVNDLDNKKALTPSLRKLLETSLTLQTTSTKVLATYFSRPPATIRADFQRILSILGDNDKNSPTRTTKNEDFL